MWLYAYVYVCIQCGHTCVGMCEYVYEVANMHISARNNIPGVETACMEQEVGKEWLFQGLKLAQDKLALDWQHSNFSALLWF